MKTIEKDLNTEKYYATKNSRGCMHPLSYINKQFANFSSGKTVIDMGCAYGNTSIAALNAGAKKVIVCDMEIQHLEALQKQAENSNLTTQLEIRQGIFPHDFHFKASSIDAFHASHIFEYLDGKSVENALSKLSSWLKSGGKLFLLTYTIFIKELDNPLFREKYKKRKEAGISWPGYLEHYNAYCTESGDTSDFADNIEPDFPESLHLYELEILQSHLEVAGFIIESIDYLDGKTNAAVKETWLDGRELLGVVACKP